VGLDWGTEFHRVCVLDAKGILREDRIDHTGSAITAFLRILNEIAGGKTERVAVAIEVPRGPVVEAFLEGGFAVFSINPKQLDRFRDRYTVAGAKEDRRDAYVAADSLARCSVQHDPLSKLHYARLRPAGHNHGRALRRIADRLLAVLIAMLKTGKHYDAKRRQNGGPAKPADA
jgi:hypothetical protein